MASHLHNCVCESCEHVQRQLNMLAEERPHEIKCVKVGEITVSLQSNGKIHITAPMIMTRPLAGLTKSNVLDLIVALDGVTNEMPD